MKWRGQPVTPREAAAHDRLETNDIQNSGIFSTMMRGVPPLQAYSPNRGKTMIQVQLRPEIEAQLAAEAQDYGLALDRYIEKIVDGRTVMKVQRHSIGQAIDRIRELR